jgi:hypothetical protein
VFKRGHQALFANTVTGFKLRLHALVSSSERLQPLVRILIDTSSSYTEFGSVDFIDQVLIGPQGEVSGKL